MSDPQSKPFSLNCPLPHENRSTIQMAHGGGGRWMQDLIEGMFLPAFSKQAEAGKPQPPPHDSAIIELGETRLAFTTDSFVVSPLFFPGGDIGHLAVCGTVNDLAMAGAKPLCLSAAFILEEGFPMESLQRIVDSIQRTSEEVGVKIVTGDTKVVDRGRGDGIYINTAGIGLVPSDVDISPRRVAVGDAIILSGDLGRHGIAIMSVREGLQFEGALPSDCAPLADVVEQLTALGSDIHCLRDLTRGGLAASLHEIATHAQVGIELREEAVPVAASVAGACELLGLDPLYVANEGRFVAFVPAETADEAVRILREHSASPEPVVIGTVTEEHPGMVELKNAMGTGRIVDLLSGEQMPRIC